MRVVSFLPVVLVAAALSSSALLGCTGDPVGEAPGDTGA